MKLTTMLAAVAASVIAIEVSAQTATNVCGTNVLEGEHLSLSHFDTNSDGIISSNELAAAGVALSQRLQTNLFGKYDANGDGAITSDEILTVTEASAERWLMIGFSAFDWKPAPVIARRTSRLEVTATTARFRKTTTESS